MRTDLQKFVADSTLSEEDKSLWCQMVEKIDDNQAGVLIDFLGGSQENLKLLTENIKNKVEAIENLDTKAMEKILKKEI